MLALRNGSFVLVCALSGCFLDEGPLTGAQGDAKMASTAATSESARVAGRPGFVPRDPGVSTGRNAEMDASEPQSSAQPSEDAATARSDAAASKPVQARPDAGAKPPIADAQVALDAASPKPDATTLDAAQPSMRDAQVAKDAAMHEPDARVAEDAAVRMLPQPIHRYDFAGSGRVAVDVIGDADGQLRPGSYLDGMGSVTLARARETDVGVELPSGLFSELTAFTVVGWLSVRTQECWQRLFDFTFVDQRGSGMGMGMSSTQVSALFLTPYGCPDGFPIAGYVTEQTQYRVTGDEKLLKPQGVMLGLMYDSNTRVLELIVDGVVRQQSRVPINLRELARARGGLGRSYGADDPALSGSISEFRIYAQTLDAATLTELARRGPDQL